MIAVDWGTSRFRAYHMDGSRILDRVETDQGILAVQGRFAGALRDAVGPWLTVDNRILLSGMVGSRQGWVEAPYVPCPAGAAELAGALTPVPFDGATVLLLPGLSDTGADGVPEVMRGEEAQVMGELDHIGAGVACLPGSHSKWVRLSAGRIAGFTTHLTGEAFTALRQHTILGRLMVDGPHDALAFQGGVTRSGEAGGLLHHLFGVRALGLMGTLQDTGAASYLSGLLIGHEVRAAAPAGPVHLIGATELCARYAEAIALCGGSTALGDRDAAAHGLALVGSLARWT